MAAQEHSQPKPGNKVPQEHRYPTPSSPGYPNTVKAQENSIKFNIIKKIDAFKEEMNISIKEIQEKSKIQAKR